MRPCGKRFGQSRKTNGIEEKSFGQLSDELGMSYKTVASLYYRAIKKLRRFMEEGESK